MESSDIFILFSRYNMIMKYKKYLSRCPKTKFDRKMYSSIEKKLLRELHYNQLGNDIFGLIYNHNIAIQEEASNSIMSSKRFFNLYSGFIPFEETDEYILESKQVDSIICADWQRITYSLNLKYHNI